VLLYWCGTAAGGGYDDDDDVGGDGGYDGGWGDLGDMLLAGDGEGLEMVQASGRAWQLEAGKGLGRHSH